MTGCGSGYREGGQSTNENIGGSIPGSSSLRAEVSLGKPLNPTLPLTAALAVYEWRLIEEVLYKCVYGCVNIISTVKRFGWSMRLEKSNLIYEIDHRAQNFWKWLCADIEIHSSFLAWRSSWHGAFSGSSGAFDQTT